MVACKARGGVPFTDSDDLAVRTGQRGGERCAVGEACVLDTSDVSTNVTHRLVPGGSARHFFSLSSALHFLHLSKSGSEASEGGQRNESHEKTGGEKETIYLYKRPICIRTR